MPAARAPEASSSAPAAACTHYKTILVGDSSVGKTALCTRVTEGTFNDQHVSTIGSQFVSLPLEIGNKSIQISLWDTAGQECYRSLVSFYCRDAKGCIIVFDVTNEGSFQSVPEWLTFVNDQAPGCKIIVFANKTDLVQERTVRSETIRAFADGRGLECFEGSARSGRNCTEVFERLGEMLLAASGPDPDQKLVFNRKSGSDGGCRC